MNKRDDLMICDPGEFSPRSKCSGDMGSLLNPFGSKSSQGDTTESSADNAADVTIDILPNVDITLGQGAFAQIEQPPGADFAVMHAAQNMVVSGQPANESAAAIPEMVEKIAPALAVVVGLWLLTKVVKRK